MPEVISSFRGKHNSLSNFSNHMVTINDVIYRTSEHAFQAAKATNEEDRAYVASAPTAAEAKKRGRQIKLRPDWDLVNINIMIEILCAKIDQNRDVYDMLIGTGDAILIEGNTWNDKYWGAVFENGEWVGENHLGKCWMILRNVLTKPGDKT